MKKLIILIISFLLVGCFSGKKLDQTLCTNTLVEPVKIERTLKIDHKDNLIVAFESVDKIYFEEDFTKNMFRQLMVDLKQRHKDSKNLVFSEEIYDDYGILTIKLINFDQASPAEKMLIGIEKDDGEFVPGLAETIFINQKEGYICRLVED